MFKITKNGKTIIKYKEEGDKNAIPILCALICINYSFSNYVYEN